MGWLTTALPNSTIGEPCLHTCHRLRFGPMVAVLSRATLRIDVEALQRMTLLFEGRWIRTKPVISVKTRNGSHVFVA